MIKRVIFVSLMILSLSNCQKKGSVCNLDISYPILVLYRTNDNLIKKNSMLNDSLKSVIDKLHELSGELMEQSGGVDKDGVFLDPCNGGVNKILNRENFYNPISHMVKSLDEKNSMNRKAAVLLKNSFLVDEAPLSVEKIKNKTTLEACLYLLSVENRILVDIE